MRRGCGKHCAIIYAALLPSNWTINIQRYRLLESWRSRPTRSSRLLSSPRAASQSAPLLQSSGTEEMSDMLRKSLQVPLSMSLRRSYPLTLCVGWPPRRLAGSSAMTVCTVRPAWSNTSKSLWFSAERASSMM